VLDLKGEKRFKKQKLNDNRGSVPRVDDLDVDDLDFNKAKLAFRKQSQQTRYNQVFGDRPKADEAFKIVKQKQIGELPLSSILKPQVTVIIDKWLRIND
jgi:hypothetical protein